jgi:hypothetical protein
VAKFQYKDRWQVESVVRQLRAAKRDAPCEYCGTGEACASDCHDSEIVVLSTGYAEVWETGHVTQDGACIFEALPEK